MSNQQSIGVSMRNEKCDDCNRPLEYCACVLKERVALADARRDEAIAEAYRARRLWQAAAACLAHHQPKPRGEDEKRLLALAYTEDHGPFWAGTTDGWIEES